MVLRNPLNVEGHSAVRVTAVNETSNLGKRREDASVQDLEAVAVLKYETLAQKSVCCHVTSEMW